MKKRKAFLWIFVLAASLIFLSITAYGSTQENIQNQAQLEAMKEAYGKNFNAASAPVQTSEIEDDINGTVSITETDISLPGKNGLDFKLTRKYVQGNTDKLFANYITKYVSNDYTSEKAIGYYYQNQSGQTKLIAFADEYEMLENAKDSYIAYKDRDTYQTGTNSVSYALFEPAEKEGEDTETLTRVKEKEPILLKLATNEQIHYTEKGKMYAIFGAINPNWTLNIPKLEKQGDWGYIFATEEGTVETIRQESVGTDAEIKGRYRTEVAENTTHAKGFQYDVKVYDTKTGKYFYFEEIAATTSTLSNKYYYIQAVGDAYDNVIRYEFLNEMISKITDTFGREIIFTYGENNQDKDATVTVTVHAGEEIIRKVEYIQRRMIDENASSLKYDKDPTVDPDPYVDIDRKYWFVVQIDKDASTKVTTEYVMTKKAMFYSGYEAHYATKHICYLIDKAKRESLTELRMDYEMYTRGSSIYEVSYDFTGVPYLLKKPLSKQDFRVVEKKYMYYIGPQQHNSDHYTYDYNVDDKAVTVLRIADGLRTTHRFDKDGKKTGILYYDTKNTLIEEIQMEYAEDAENGNKPYLSKQTHLEYTYEPFKDVIDQYKLSTVKEYTYKNDLLMTASDERGTTEYTYFDNGIMQSKVYPRDDTHTVKEENILTEDGKSIASSLVYEKTDSGDYELKAKTDFTYDSIGNVTSSTVMNAPEEDVTVNYVYTYPEDGTFTVEKSVANVRDADGNLAQADGVVTEKSWYDTAGNLVKTQNGLDKLTTMSYDLLGRLTKTTHPDGEYSTVAYSDTANTVTETDELGTVVTYDYDERGLLSNIREGTNYLEYNYLEYNEYDSLGRITLAKDERGYQTIYEYDIRDRVVATRVEKSFVGKPDYTQPDTGTKPTTYTSSTISYPDNFHNSLYLYQDIKYLTKDGSPSLGVKRKTDKWGQLVSETKYAQDGTGSQTVSYAYDKLGNIVTVTDAMLNTQSYEYDFAGRVVKVTNAEGNSALTAYNGLGNVVSETDFEGNKTEYRYDALGRQIEAKVPVDEDTFSLKRMYYDDAGNLIKEKVQNNAPGEAESFAEKEYKYNARNMLVGVIEHVDANSMNVTQYVLDAKGQVLKEIKGLTAYTEDLTDLTPYAVTTYAYNVLGQVTSITDALGVEETYTYNDQKELVKVSKGGVDTTYSYDYYGNLLNVNNLTYTYDHLGNLTKMEDETGVTTYTYSKLGMLSGETKGNTQKAYTYDNRNNLRSLKLTVDGVTELEQQYTYNKLNALVQADEVVNGVVTPLAKYTYSQNGRVTKLEYPAGNYYEEYAYNKMGNLTEKESYKGTALQSRDTYEYYLDGTQKSKTEGGKTTAYAYDDLGRLTKEQQGEGFHQTFTYDAYGNRDTLTQTEGNLTKVSSYTYDKNNRLLTVEQTENDALKQITRYSYDNRGNTLSKLEEQIAPLVQTPENTFGLTTDENGLPEGLTLYHYNDLDQLTGMETNETAASYVYDGTGLRVSKTVNGETTNHIWSGMQMIAETDADGAVTNKYYRGNQLIAADIQGKRSYYLYNSHGDVQATVNSAWQTVSDYGYDAFGNETETDANDRNPFRYAGEYYDSESGMIYLRARYYSPSTGRFLTEDPQVAGVNWYVYCSNNLVNRMDPLGLTDVMIEYIMNKIGGTVSFDSATGNITATHGNTSFIYTPASGNLEWAVVDSALLADVFSLSEEEVLHQPGDDFYKEEHAAYAFGLMNYDDSMVPVQNIDGQGYGSEYGAYIYYQDGMYFFGELVSAGVGYVSFPPVLPAENIVAYVHLHGFGGSEYFSGSKEVAYKYSNNDGKGPAMGSAERTRYMYSGDGGYASSHGINAYLLTPRKTFKRVSSSWEIPKETQQFLYDSDSAVSVVVSSYGEYWKKK